MNHLAACLFSYWVVGAAPLLVMPSVDDDLDEGNHSDSHICNCQYLAVAKLHAAETVTAVRNHILVKVPSHP